MSHDLTQLTTGLNAACADVGICPPAGRTARAPGAIPTISAKGIYPETPGVQYAAELTKDNVLVRVACFEDGCVSSCVLKDGKTKGPCCYTHDKGGIDLAKDWVKHLEQSGYQAKEIEVEE